MKNISGILLTILVITAVACNKNKTEPIEKPLINFVSMTPNVVQNGSFKDTVIINLKYAMAASGVQSKTDTNEAEVLFIDSREAIVGRQAFPQDMAGNLPDGQKEIKGDITLRLPAILYMILRADRPDGDTLFYKIVLKDKDNTISDTITTPEIYIVP